MSAQADRQRSNDRTGEPDMPLLDTQPAAGRRGAGHLAVIITLVMAAALVTWLAPASASAAGCQAWTGAQPPSPGTGGTVLDSVTVLSPCNAWAVGFAGGTAQTLIEHWDGASWTVVPSPDPGSTLNILNGVRAVSADDVWAVGQFKNADDINHVLIVHWNGTSWKQVNSPDPGTTLSLLLAVRAVSARDVWAVGYYSTGNGNRTLIMHWNGSAWRQVPSPDPAHDNVLTGLATTSAGNAWAVGFTGLVDRTLIVHWNGKRWSRVTSPSPGTGNYLTAVGATTAGNAWAVGVTDNGSMNTALIVHWNGKRWTHSTTPGLGAAQLDGVTVTSAGNAWAVGGLVHSTTHTALVLRWNGRSWTRVRAPSPGASADYLAVAATSASNAWAVGGYTTGSGPGLTLAAHCC
jgi:hypothetical protein